MDTTTLVITTAPEDYDYGTARTVLPFGILEQRVRDDDPRPRPVRLVLITGDEGTVAYQLGRYHSGLHLGVDNADDVYGGLYAIPGLDEATVFEAFEVLGA